MANMTEHRFFCMNCGQEGIQVWRKTSHKYQKHHRKKLYCYHCKQDVNHVECRNDEEVREFREAFANGEYKDEVKESLDFIAKENLIWS